MLVILEKTYNKKEISEKIKNLKPAKIFDPLKFAGKIIWEEEPLEFQKRIRNEWD